MWWLPPSEPRARRLTLRPRTIRPKVIRRIVHLPGSSRMRRPELEPTPLGTSAEQKRIEIFDGPLSTCSDVLYRYGAEQTL